MFKSILYGMVTLVGCHFAFSQNSDYTYKFSQAGILEIPNINSYAEEIFPLYDSNYDTLFFVRSHHNGNVGKDKINQDIWYAYKTETGWSDAKNFKALNNAENNSIVGISGTTETLYLLNSYTSTLLRNKGIVKVRYKNGEWTKPATIDFEVNTGNNLYSFYINGSEDVILITMFNAMSEGEEDLFVSLKSESGHWRDPIYMGHQVNSEGFETSPFLTADKKTLFFTSDGFNGYGDGDVYMSKRLDDGWMHWSEPVNLGRGINSNKFDGYFSLYENGEYLLASNRDGKFSDIFTGTWEKVKIEKKAEIKEEVPVVTAVAPKMAKEALPKPFDIYFGFNSIKYDENIYRESLQQVASYMKKNPEVGLILEGHTDPVGDDTYNLILSLQRAKTVEDYLKTLLDGDKDDRITVVPSGESKTKTDENKSRRVTLKYIILER